MDTLNHEVEVRQYSQSKHAEKGVLLSIIAYSCLAVGKLIAGYLFGSAALVADGYNSATDIMASLAVMVGIRISQKPPDDDHPYGHFKAETIAALIASFIMAMVGIQLIISTVQNFLASEIFTAPSIVTAYVAGASALCIFCVYLYNRRLAKRMNNLALKAAAQDNLSDAYVSIGAFVGIIGSQFGIPWLDPLAAILVGLIICKTAWDIFYSSTHVLTDGFEEEDLVFYFQTIMDIPEVCEVKDLRARLYGSQVMLDVVVLVDPTLSLVESHRISDVIEEELRDKAQILRAHVHVEPDLRSQVSAQDSHHN
jgi:cation diffusion facilitator family transporter